MVSEGQTICLAVTIDICIIVHRLARTGSTDENRLCRHTATCLNFDAADPRTLYGDPRGYTDGLNFIADTLSGKVNAEQMEVFKMVNSALQLQRSLRRSPGVEARLGESLHVLNPEDFEVPFPPSSWTSLNDIYVESLSLLRPSIIVRGAEGHLQNPNVVAKVRGALLAAVRSAYFWYQLGGRRWHMMFWRRQYGEFARGLLAT